MPNVRVSRSCRFHSASVSMMTSGPSPLPTWWRNAAFDSRHRDGPRRSSKRFQHVRLNSRTRRPEFIYSLRSHFRRRSKTRKKRAHARSVLEELMRATALPSVTPMLCNWSRTSRVEGRPDCFRTLEINSWPTWKMIGQHRKCHANDDRGRHRLPQRLRQP